MALGGAAALVVGEAELELGQTIGNGASGCVVVHGKLRGQACAVKVLKADRASIEGLNQVKSELTVMGLCDHPHLLGTLGIQRAGEHGQEWRVCMQYLPQSLRDKFQQQHRETAAQGIDAVGQPFSPRMVQFPRCMFL